MKRAPLLALAALFLLAAHGARAADEGPRVVSVAPAVIGDGLVCDVTTSGLPTEKAVRSMGGGLPSAVDLVIELVDGEGDVVERRRVTYRIVFDLWDEIFRVESDRADVPVEGIEGVRAFLARFDALPIASIASLAGSDRYRLRVGVVSHAIAPSEKSRIGGWIAGEGAGTGEDTDEREVTLGLGSLIRFVFGGSGDGDLPAGVGESPWFRPDDLARKDDPDA